MRALIDGIRLAIRAVTRNPMRASLTVLGILIGVAAVVTVTALGSGAREHVSKQIQAIGSNFVIIFPQVPQASGARGSQGSGIRLTEDDGRAILRESPSLVAIAPTLRAPVQAVYGDQNCSTQVVGTTTSYLVVRNWPIDRGRAWDEHDEAVKSKVVILGSTVARKLFGTEDAIGRSVRIGRYPYLVLGILTSKGEAPFGLDQDDVILMPSSSFRSRVLHTPPGFAGALVASATSPETSPRAVRQIQSILRQRHRLEAGRDDDFTIRTQKEFADLQARIYGILTDLFIFVAAISLLVGGIGVMNIMLVSVTERTREIGIRMAVGAREGDIRTQFLVEAVALSVLGGLAGVGLGGVAIVALQTFLEWHMSLSPLAITVSIAVSGATGVVFGFIPAQRAAGLDPIDALRHE